MREAGGYSPNSLLFLCMGQGVVEHLTIRHIMERPQPTIILAVSARDGRSANFNFALPKSIVIFQLKNAVGRFVSILIKCIPCV